MSYITINTTQNVNLNFSLASIGDRFLALIIDLIIISSYMFVVVVISEFFNINELDNWSARAIVSIISLPAMLYTLLSETFSEGQTFGKKVMKIKVVKIEGYSASFVDYFARWIMRIPDIWAFAFLGTILIIVSKNSQRLGGMASGTAVISYKDKYDISHTILENIDNNYKVIYPSVINLSDNDIRVVKDSFENALKTRNYKTIERLRKKVEEVTKTSKGESNSIDYIRTVIKDYTFITQEM